MAAYIIGSHPVVLVNARQSQYITIESGSPVEVGNVQGGLKNSGQRGHPWLLIVFEPTLF